MFVFEILHIHECRVFLKPAFGIEIKDFDFSAPPRSPGTQMLHSVSGRTASASCGCRLPGKKSGDARCRAGAVSVDLLGFGRKIFAAVPS